MITGFDPTRSTRSAAPPRPAASMFAKPGARTSWDAHYTGFQPRIGVAYQMPHQVVLRVSTA